MLKRRTSFNFFKNFLRNESNIFLHGACFSASLHLSSLFRTSSLHASNTFYSMSAGTSEIAPSVACTTLPTICTSAPLWIGSIGTAGKAVLSQPSINSIACLLNIAAAVRVSPSTLHRSFQSFRKSLQWVSGLMALMFKSLSSSSLVHLTAPPRLERGFSGILFPLSEDVSGFQILLVS